jgi:YegS/Rv2252/BmrU family lipid kinase
MKHIFLINSFSLKEKTKDLKNKIEEVCKKVDLDFVIEVNSEKESTEEIIKKYKNQKVILLPVGGDGTINRVLNAMDIKNNILGYIPYGTGNDFYRANKELLKEGINQIDLGKINDHYFINVVCFGIDADIGNDSNFIHNEKIKKENRYKTGVFYHFLAYKLRGMKIEINNETIEEDFTTIAVCNARYYGGGYKIAPHSSLEDGLFDVYIVKKTDRFNMMRLIAGIKYAFHENSNKVRKIQTNELKITSLNEIASNIDGEVLTSNSFDIKIIPKGIEVYYNQTLIDKIIK